MQPEFITKNNAQKMNLLVKDSFSKCEQILKKLRIYSHLLKKFLTENFIFCAVKGNVTDYLKHEVFFTDGLLFKFIWKALAIRCAWFDT